MSEEEQENEEKKENEFTKDPLDVEYKKLLKKQQEQEAKLNLIAAQEQAWMQEQEAQRRQMDENWTDSTRCLVSKQVLSDLYFCLFIGNQDDAFKIIGALVNSISAYDGQTQQENRMLVDKKLMNNLTHYYDKQDWRALYSIASELCYTLSPGQRREIVVSIIRHLKETGGMEDMNLIAGLEESIGNPGIFRI